MSVKVKIYDKQNKISISPENRRLIRRACSAALKSEKFTEPAEVDVSIVDDEQIKQINADCRGIDASTDVLSFPLGENGIYDKNIDTGAYMLGDIVISIEHATAQANEYGHSTDREIAYLTVHSILHLLGYDHVNSEKEKKVMREHEECVMSALKLER
ncbi:MAG: rRNA maturation RNase YbeY [Clostridia bacterium]|nr:rRNA maturation RNase YbeY [Clostridia bacterium]